MANEIWKPVENVNSRYRYEVSDLGNVRNATRGNFLHKSRKSNGYFEVSVGKRKVQLLVADAFLGDAQGRFVLHNDGDKANNSVSNLRYGTSHDNRMDTFRHGRAFMPKGTLTKEQVEEIRLRAKARYHGMVNDLAAEYGVNRHTICNVINFRVWNETPIGEKP